MIKQIYDTWIVQMKNISSILTRTVNAVISYVPDRPPRQFLPDASVRSVESGLPSCSQGNSWITAFTWVKTSTAWQRSNLYYSISQLRISIN